MIGVKAATACQIATDRLFSVACWLLCVETASCEFCVLIYRALDHDIGIAAATRLGTQRTGFRGTGLMPRLAPRCRNSSPMIVCPERPEPGDARSQNVGISY